MRLFVFLLCALWLQPAHATTNVLNDLLKPAKQTFLPVDQAFTFDFDQQGNTLFIGWDIAPGYYLYKKKLEIIAKGADIKVPDLGEGVVIEDEFFGKSEVFYNSVTIDIPITQASEDGVIKIRYQGCDTTRRLNAGRRSYRRRQ